jgi:hypothetical protein
MMAVHQHRLGASALITVALALLLPVQVQAAQASTTQTCAGQCWASIGDPLYTQVGPYDMIETNYTNIGGVNLTGIVFAVVHNNLGQTVEISTGTLQLAAGANGTAFAAVFGLPDGEYSGTIFAVSTSGVAISFTITVAFTIVVVD